MISNRYLAKGPAFAGALLLSACTETSPLHDTFFVVTRPLDLAAYFLIVTILVLAAWWMILKLSPRQPKPLFIASVSALIIGLTLAALPTLMLVTGIVWPSLVVIFQLAALGGGIVMIVLIGTAALLVWRLIAALIDRL